MSCNDTSIADALNNIAIALNVQANATATSGCGSCGANGAGQSGPPLDPVVPPTDQEGPPPEGFASWEQYLTNRCNVATDIIIKAKGSVSNMSLLNLAGLTLVSLIPILVPLMLDVIPGDELAVIGAVLLAVLALGAGLIDQTHDTISGHQDALICALYQNNSATAAEQSVEAAFAEFFSEDHPSSPFYFGAGQLFGSLMNSAVINRLTQLNTAVVLPTGDCSACEEVCVDCLGRLNQAVVVIADLAVPSAGWFEMVSLNEDSQTVYIRAVGPDDYRVKFRNLVGWTFVASPNFVCRQNSGDVFYAGDDFDDFAAACALACITAEDTIQWAIASDTAFTVEAKTENCV